MNPIAKISPLEAKTRYKPSWFLTGRANFQKLFAGVALPTLFATALPAVVFAATLSSIVVNLKILVNQLVAFVIGLAVLVFLWGVLKYITAGADSKKVEEARNFIIFGIIGIFVMFSIWGLINLLSVTLNLSSTKPTAPTF